MGLGSVRQAQRHIQRHIAACSPPWQQQAQVVVASREQVADGQGTLEHELAVGVVDYCKVQALLV